MATQGNCTCTDDCACDRCVANRSADAKIAGVVSAMPQFDVPEQLTQNIMASVAAQPARSFAHSLALPVAVVGGALLCTVLPFDSLEGLLSTAVGMVALFGVQLVLKSASTEEVVA